jgi:dihydrofolate reductase
MEVAVRHSLLSFHAQETAGRARGVGAACNRNVWVVGGGDLAGQFADAGLLDEVLVQIAPVTLGAGAPLLPRRIELRLDELGRNGDFACAKFTIVDPPD